MPDLLVQALALPGLYMVLLTALIAGIVYGFAGFGAALIFMPVAIRVMPPETAIAAFSISALSSLITVVPRALPQVNRRAVTILVLNAAIAASAGVFVLRTADVTVLRWAVIVITTVTLLALFSGWRYKVQPTDKTRAIVGLATGFVGGATGLVGPILVLFQLSGQDSVARSRATTLVVLTLSSLLLLPLMGLQGLLTAPAIALGVLLLIPYALGCRVGQALFQPERERLYRAAAYTLIAVSILIGLPVWG